MMFWLLVLGGRGGEAVQVLVLKERYQRRKDVYVVSFGVRLCLPGPSDFFFIGNKYL